MRVNNTCTYLRNAGAQLSHNLTWKIPVGITRTPYYPTTTPHLSFPLVEGIIPLLYETLKVLLTIEKAFSFVLYQF